MSGYHILSTVGGRPGPELWVDVGEPAFPEELAAAPLRFAGGPEGLRLAAKAASAVLLNGGPAPDAPLRAGDVVQAGEFAFLVCPEHGPGAHAIADVDRPDGGPPPTEPLPRGTAAAGPMGARRRPDEPAVMRRPVLHPPPGERLPRAFGPYVLLRFLGGGGLGRVYEALNTAALRLEAVKVLNPGHLDEESVNRLFRESEAMRALDHPNVIRLYDMGRLSGEPYLAMRLIEGPTMDECVAAGDLPLYDAAVICWKAALTLDYVHRHGIIHRDIKPGNIMLDEGREPIVMDFGLAKDLARPGLTMTDQILGTPAYMSPEQAGGRMRDMGERSDVYSLGALLYYTLTGRPPFRGESVYEVLLQVTARDPDPAVARFTGSPTVQAERERIRRGVCPARSGASLAALLGAFQELAEIARRAMAKDPAGRPAMAAEIAEALDAVLERVQMPVSR